MISGDYVRVNVGALLCVLREMRAPFVVEQKMTNNDKTKLHLLCIECIPL